MSDTLRLFVALELPSNVLDALVSVQHDLRARFPSKAARWVRPEGIHLTLKFLGDVPAAQVDEVASALRAAAAGHTRIELQAAGLGVYPNPKRARVVWVGVTGDLDALRHLKASVEEQIAPLGYPTENRRFTPHLTLGRAGRRATRDDNEALGALVETSDVGHLAVWQAESVHLIRSQLKPGGAIYTQLAEVALASSHDTN